MKNNPYLEKIYSQCSEDDDVEFDPEQSWPKAVVCIKSFPRSGTTYIKQNLVLNNFIVIKKRWELPHNENQPLPITVLRNLKDSTVSNIVMSNLKGIDSDSVKNLILDQAYQYNNFLDSFLADMENRIPYLFSQLELNPKIFLENINNIHTLDKNKEFIFVNKIPVKRYIVNYRTNKVDVFLPSSKIDKNYEMAFNIFDEVSEFSEINDKYENLIEKIKNRQSDLRIEI